jgi:haloacetate dehalogenase
MTGALFEGFAERRIAVDRDVEIAAVIGGAGPPLLLLHGHPQTHAIWHRVAARLAEHFTIMPTTRSARWRATRSR